MPKIGLKISLLLQKGAMKMIYVANDVHVLNKSNYELSTCTFTQQYFREDKGECNIFCSYSMFSLWKM